MKEHTHHNELSLLNSFQKTHHWLRHKGLTKICFTQEVPRDKFVDFVFWALAEKTSAGRNVIRCSRDGRWMGLRGEIVEIYDCCWSAKEIQHQIPGERAKRISISYFCEYLDKAASRRRYDGFSARNRNETLLRALNTLSLIIGGILLCAYLYRFPGARKAIQMGGVMLAVMGAMFLTAFLIEYVQSKLKGTRR